MSEKGERDRARPAAVGHGHGRQYIFINIQISNIFTDYNIQAQSIKKSDPGQGVDSMYDRIYQELLPTCHFLSVMSKSMFVMSIRHRVKCVMSILSVFLLHVITYVNVHTVFRFVTNTTIYSGYAY